MQTTTKLKEYWELYYQTHLITSIPWRGEGSYFFDNMWKNYNLPQNGMLLDIGCGAGEKAFYFSRKKITVYGCDISEEAIRKAKELGENNHIDAIFFTADIRDLSSFRELQGKRFNFVLDKLVSQFLTEKEKMTYLKQLSHFVIRNETIFILQVIHKPSAEFEYEIEWRAKLSLTKEDVMKIYGKFFSLQHTFIESSRENSQVATYIMKSL